MPAPGGGTTTDAAAAEEPRDVGAQPKPQVPVRRGELVWPPLSVGYRHIRQALADRLRLGQGSLTRQEMAAEFGLDVVPARVEARRSKAQRPVARDWLTEPAPGRSTLVRGVTGPGGGARAEPSTGRPSPRRRSAAFDAADRAAGAHQGGEEPLDGPPLGQHPAPLGWSLRLATAKTGASAVRQDSMRLPV